MTPKDEWDSETSVIHKENCGYKKTGCGNIHVVVDFKDEKKTKIVRITPFLGKENSCLRHWTNVNSNLMSLALKKGASLEEVIECLCGQCGNEFVDVKSCSYATGDILRKYTEVK